MMSSLVSSGAAVVAHRGLSWQADVYRVSDRVYVAVSSADVCRVYPAAGFWWYGGRATSAESDAVVRDPYDRRNGPVGPGGAM